MLTQEHVQALVHATAYDASGHKLGKIGQIYLDNRTHAPEWATVHTGFFGNHESFVPLATAVLDGDRLQLPFDRDQVKAAPELEPEGSSLSPEQERDLYRHYGVDVAPPRPSAATDGDAAGRTSSFGPATKLADRPETYEDDPEPFPMRTGGHAPITLEPPPVSPTEEYAGPSDTPAEAPPEASEPQPQTWFSTRSSG